MRKYALEIPVTDNHNSILTQTEHIISQKKKVATISLHANNHTILTPTKFNIKKERVITKSEKFFVKTNLHDQRKDSQVIRIHNGGDQNNCR